MATEAAPRSLRLAVFDDQVFHPNGAGWGTDEAHLLFMTALSRHFGRTTFLGRVAEEQRPCPYQVPDSVRVCPLPYYESLVHFCLRAPVLVPRVWRILTREAPEWDVVWLAWPHPISLLALMAMGRRRRARAVLVVRQDLGELVKLRYHGLRRLAAVQLVRLLEAQGRRWKDQVAVLTVGGAVYERLRQDYRNVLRVSFPVISRETAARSEGEKSPRTGGPMRLLFVGRLDPEKGLHHLLEAVAKLKSDGIPVELDLVGSGPEEAGLRELARVLGCSDEIRFAGYVPFGEPLFARYRWAEGFVLPSLSEGVPNVLAEALCFGLPIVATRVGGIPDLIRDGENGLLVEPGSAEAVAAAVRRLQSDDDLAARLRERAPAEASRHTLEAEVERMVEWVGARV